MMEDGTSLRIGDQVRLRPGALLPSSQVPHDTDTTFVVAHLDRSREADGDVLVTIRAVTGASTTLTVPSRSLQRAVKELTQEGTRHQTEETAPLQRAVRKMLQPDAKRPAEAVPQFQPLVALLEQIVARLDRQETLLTEIRDALRHRGEVEDPPPHTVRY
jgi:hypothetical protein